MWSSRSWFFINVSLIILSWIFVCLWTKAAKPTSKGLCFWYISIKKPTFILFFQKQCLPLRNKRDILIVPPQSCAQVITCQLVNLSTRQLVNSLTITYVWTYFRFYHLANFDWHYYWLYRQPHNERWGKGMLHEPDSRCSGQLCRSLHWIVVQCAASRCRIR